jgi:hypothetical protein
MFDRGEIPAKQEEFTLMTRSRRRWGVSRIYSWPYAWRFVIYNHIAFNAACICILIGRGGPLEPVLNEGDGGDRTTVTGRAGRRTQEKGRGDGAPGYANSVEQSAEPSDGVHPL